MSNRLVLATIAAGSLLATGTPGAWGDEVRPQLNPSLILNMLARPIESQEAAFNASLKSDAAVPRVSRADEGEVQPDGSVRYGRGGSSLTITVRNPCPPGDLAHEAMVYRSLPGRARR